MEYKLSELFDLQMGKTPSRDRFEYWDSPDYPWISIGDLSNSGKYIYETKEGISERAKSESGIKAIPANTVVMSFKLSIGKAAITSREMYSNEAIMAFIDKGIIKIVPDYLYYLLLSKEWDAGANKAVMGKTLNKATLSDMVVNIHHVNEQHRIISFLDKAKKVINAYQQLLAKLDELVKARFVEMFGGNYPEDSLLNLCNIIDYRGKTPEKVSYGLPFITAKNIRMHQMNMEPREYISEEIYNKVMTRGFPKEGDVVFTTEAPLGNICRIPHFDTNFYVGQRIVTLQPYSLEPAYLEYALDADTFREKLAEKTSGSTVTGIRVRLLEQLTISVPPQDLQKSFSDFVAQVDKSKAAVQSALDKAQLLFDSLMQKYF